MLISWSPRHVYNNLIICNDLMIMSVLIVICFLQYAPGGELFDYIVAKDKLKVFLSHMILEDLFFFTHLILILTVINTCTCIFFIFYCLHRL